MKLFIFTFVIFGLGWLSACIHNYLYEKKRKAVRNDTFKIQRNRKDTKGNQCGT